MGTEGKRGEEGRGEVLISTHAEVVDTRMGTYITALQLWQLCSVGMNGLIGLHCPESVSRE